MRIAPHAFRHYDIRALVDQELPLAEMYALGRALADYILQENPDAHSIIIGRDGRTHSSEIQRHIVQAFFDMGFTVHDTGLCPTPVVYFALYNAPHTDPYDAALMITASHNGPEYNGIKICVGKQSLWGDQIQKIQQLYMLHASSRPACIPHPTRKASYQRVAIQDQYVEYMAREFSDLRTIAHPLLADCGNGAVGSILRAVVDAVGLTDVTILCEEVDGTYPHHTANPVEEENMRHVIEKVHQERPFLAVGFDGDGDRMAAVTPDGKILSGDILLVLFAHDVLKEHPHATVVYDSKCSLVVEQAIRQHAGIPVRSPSGHSLIKKMIRETQALLGGELSCHFFFADRYFGFDDGIYAFLRLVRLLHRHEKSFSDLLRTVPHTYSTPEIRIFCADTHKHQTIELFKKHLLEDAAYTVSCDDGVRFEHAGGWGLVRASHTQPALCIRCESFTHDGLQALQKTVYDTLQKILPVAELFPLTAYNTKEVI
ncbi:unnamed protein product [Sphagnum balticum]